MEPSAVTTSDSVSLGEAGAEDVVGSYSPVGSGSEFDEQAPSAGTTAAITTTSDFTRLS